MKRILRFAIKMQEKISKQACLTKKLEVCVHTWSRKWRQKESKGEKETVMDVYRGHQLVFQQQQKLRLLPGAPLVAGPDICRSSCVQPVSGQPG